MKKRILALTLALTLSLLLASCGSSGSSGGSDPDKPGVESTEPNNTGHTDSDPLAVIQERVKAVNDAVNYECVGLEETVEAGLLFYSLTGPSLFPSELYDYNPDKPLDYRTRYQMFIAHTEGIVSEDTYAALLRDLCQNKIILPSVFSAEDVIETDDLYVYYSPQSYGTEDYRPWCYFLVKDTNIVYWFTVEEAWYKADYYKVGSYENEKLRYTDDDAEYIFTAEFWKAFAQTVKFVGKADEDFKNGECIKSTIASYEGRYGYIPISSYDDSRYIITGDINNDEVQVSIKIPYIDEWYAGGSYDRDTIYKGFQTFLKNRNRDSEIEVEVVLFSDNGIEKTYPATKKGDEVTIDLGNGQVWIYERDGDTDTSIQLREEPKSITGERLPEFGYFKYTGGTTSFLVIDDFGQGEPTMFLNNGLYKYAGGEVTLIHDFSGIDNEWMDMSINAGRTYLLFSGRGMFSYLSVVVDLKTFEVTDTVYIAYELGEEGFNEFSYATVNGVREDEMTALDECNEWWSICNIHLLSKESVDHLNFDAAWRDYESRN